MRNMEHTCKDCRISVKELEVDIETFRFIVDNYNNARSRQLSNDANSLRKVVKAVKDVIFFLTDVDVSILRKLNSKFTVGTDNSSLLTKASGNSDYQYSSSLGDIGKLLSNIEDRTGFTVSRRLLNLEVIRYK